MFNPRSPAGLKNDKTKPPFATALPLAKQETFSRNRRSYLPPAPKKLPLRALGDKHAALSFFGDSCT